MYSSNGLLGGIASRCSRFALAVSAISHLQVLVVGNSVALACSVASATAGQLLSVDRQGDLAERAILDQMPEPCRRILKRLDPVDHRGNLHALEQREDCLVGFCH